MKISLRCSAPFAWLTLAILLLAPPRPLDAQQDLEAVEPPPYELWLPREDNPRATGMSFVNFLLLDSRGATYRDPIRVNRLIEEIGRSPFENIVIQVRAFGDAYYTSEMVPKALGVSENFDPLDVVLKGMKSGTRPRRVYAWLELYRVANVNRAVPLQPGHILKQHPEWLSRDSNFRTEDAAGNQYLELGLDSVQEYLEALVTELLKRYPLDGVVLDGVRYPGTAANWGYHPTLLDAWRRETGSVDAPAPDDPTWIQLRRRLVDRAVHRLQISARDARPGARTLAVVTSEGPAPDDLASFLNGPIHNGALQNWPAWMEKKYVDGLILLNFRQEGPDSAVFDAWNDFAVREVERTGVEVYPAVAGFANISIDTLSQIRRIQDLGLAGAVLSNYLEPVRDSASRELFFRALAKTVFASDSERLTFLPREEPGGEDAQVTEIAGLPPEEFSGELPDDMAIELPPPPSLDPFELSPELVPTLEPQPAEEEQPRVASLLDEASQRLSPRRDALIEPPFQAMEFLRQKYPNIF